MCHTLPLSLRRRQSPADSWWRTRAILYLAREHLQRHVFVRARAARARECLSEDRQMLYWKAPDRTSHHWKRPQWVISTSLLKRRQPASMATNTFSNLVIESMSENARDPGRLLGEKMAGLQNLERKLEGLANYLQQKHLSLRVFILICLFCAFSCTYTCSNTSTYTCSNASTYTCTGLNFMHKLR